MIVFAIALLAAAQAPEGRRARYDICIESAVDRQVSSGADVLTVVNQSMASCAALFQAAADEMVEDAAEVGALPLDLTAAGRKLLARCELAGWTKDMSLRRILALRAKK